MPICFAVASLGSEATTTGEFSDEEWDVLKTFALAVERLQHADLFKNQRLIRFSVGDEDQSVVPPDIEVHQLLHLLRPIILEGERYYLPTVTALLGRRIEHPAARALLKRLRRRFIYDPNRENWHSSRDGVVLDSEEFLKVWLYSHEYHWDAARMQEFQKMHTGPMAKSTLAAVLLVLIRKAQVAFTLRKIIETLELGGETKHGLRFTRLDGSVTT
jgi:hypothetical protein